MSQRPATEDFVNVRYIVDDVDAAIHFYTAYLGFDVRSDASPAFADVVRGNLRLLLSGPRISATRDARRKATIPGWLEPDPPARR